MRVPDRGLLDPARPVTFRFDGKRVTGLDGDTIASALLANGIRLMGRSFKYHRPRGVVTAGSDEPNALVTLGHGQSQRPNCRATMEPITDGMAVRSQNAWPSLRRDALAVNDLAWRFLGAGFYYKTFMWPKSFWEKLYEPAIRRAAGLGALSGIHAADDAGKAFLFCDLLVIGAGPTGLMAALTAARAGADVLIADEATAPGGRLLSEREDVDGKPGHVWAADMAQAIRDAGGRVLLRTAVTSAYDGGIYGALQTGGVQTFWRITAARAVLAAGALERPIAFRDNDRPGIMGAGAIRTYLNRFGVAAARRHVIFTNNDDGHRTALDLRAADLSVVVVDSRPDPPAGQDYEVVAGGTVTGTRGRLGLEEVQISAPGGKRRLRAGCLGVSGGWNPAVHLACHMNGRPVWRDDIAAFVPTPDAVPGLGASGAARGIFNTAGCLRDGADAATAALRHMGQGAVPVTLPAAAATPAYRIAPLWSVPGGGRAWLDFQNDVTVKDVTQAAQENFRSVEHMKRYTTQGMATDQGKGGSVLALAVLADATGRAIPDTGTTTFRPPYVPVPLKAYGAGARGPGFAPVRLTPSHAASLERDAAMVEAGLWMRPGFFPKPGERTWRESCDREVGYVRNAVGICDVTTLGKIDVQGPGAASFLDLVYAGRISSLEVGRVRYGVMLREDGHILDDGTVACLADQHFVLTTTTVAAGNVMRHLQFVAQCLAPDLDVALGSVTEQWAQFAVAGPASRRLLDLVLDAPLEDGWPFMSCGDVSVDGVGARLFRISFSGEHAYELAVPARFGDALFRRLVAEAEGLGGGAYGLEALNVLRIEKGFPTHAEMDGRATLDDLGLGGMLRGDTTIGARMAARPGLSGSDRAQLVGLQIKGAPKGIGAGARLYAKGVAPSAATCEGRVSSICWSPTLGCTLGLGFLRHGRSRHGETLDLRDAMRGGHVSCTVADPVAFDPDGGRMRGKA